jgi:predicted GNAT family acetyltransferase
MPPPPPPVDISDMPPPPAPKAEDFFDPAQGFNAVTPGGEIGANLVTGATSGALAGAAGYVKGLVTPGDESMEASRRWSEAATYQPRSEEAKKDLQAIGEASHTLMVGRPGSVGEMSPTGQDVLERATAIAPLIPAAQGAKALIGGLAERAGARGAVKAATAASAAAEAAPVDAAKAHLTSVGVPVEGVPVEGAPGKTIPATSQQLSQGYNRAVLSHVGETGPNAASPLDALPAARERITGVMDDVSDRTAPQFDTELAGDLQRIQRNLPGRMSDDAAAPIHRNIETLIDAASKNDGTIPGPVLQEVNRNLRSLEANPTLHETAGDVHEALGDLVSRHAAPGDVEALATARNQYRALKQVEGAINPTTGDVDPKRLMTQLGVKKNRNQSLYGAGDQGLMQTARAGARVLPDMHAGLANQQAGTLSAGDRVRIKLANVLEGAGTAAIGMKTGGLSGLVTAGLTEGTVGPAFRGMVVRATGGSKAAATIARGQSPLGERLGGGKQRGGPKFEPGNPYNNTPPERDIWGSERAKPDRTNKGPEPRTGNPYDTGGTVPLGQRIFGGKQRGAVGDLRQRAAIQRESKPNGDGNTVHRYMIPGKGGSMNVVEYPGRNVRQVQTSNVNREARGQGWGTQMLAKAADDAHANGQVLHSDERVSGFLHPETGKSGGGGQVGSYENLKNLGYDVRTMPHDNVGGDVKAVGDHVFEVRPPAPTGGVGGMLDRATARINAEERRTQQREFEGADRRRALRETQSAYDAALRK